MKSPTLFATAIVLGLPAAASVGGPLRLDWISADAEWIVHVDCEALAASSLGPYEFTHILTLLFSTVFPKKIATPYWTCRINLARP